MYIKNTQCLLLNLLEAYLILSVVNVFFFVFVILNKLTSNQYDVNLYIFYSYTLYSINL